MKDDVSAIKQLAHKMRVAAIKMGYEAGSKGAHFGGGLSAIEILACLYGGVLDIDSQHPNNEDRDVFIASKAHCVLALYPALAYTGFFQKEDLHTFELNESELSGHPAMNLQRGIEISGGSLGMGLAQGVGIALAYRRKNINKNVFVLLGDGECEEGSVWESVMTASHFQMDSLIVVIDNNHLQYDGLIDDITDLHDLKAKFESFGFEAYKINGHDIETMYALFCQLKYKRNKKPKLVIADTIKGKGISFMEGQVEWHHGILSQELYQRALAELGSEVK